MILYISFSVLKRNDNKKIEYKSHSWRSCCNGTESSPISFEKPKHYYFFYVCPFQCVAHGDLQVKKDLKIILTGIVFPGAYRCLFCLLSPTAFGIRTSKTSIDPTLLVPFFHFWRTFLYVLVPKRPPIAKRTLILSNKFEFFPSYICMRILPSMPREYPANLYISFLIHF